MKFSLKSALAVLTVFCCLFALCGLSLRPQPYPDLYIAAGVASSRGSFGFSLVARKVELQRVVAMVAEEQKAGILVADDISELEVDYFRGDGATPIKVLQDLCSEMDLKVTQTGPKQYQIERE